MAEKSGLQGNTVIVTSRPVASGDIEMDISARVEILGFTSHEQWPPPCKQKVFNLAMIVEEEVQRGRIKDSFVRMSITGKLDDIMQLKYPIKLENIFKDVDPKQRKVVLMEGAPGCGKSTLSVFISQQWGEGKLFTEYMQGGHSGATSRSEYSEGKIDCRSYAVVEQK